MCRFRGQVANVWRIYNGSLAIALRWQEAYWDWRWLGDILLLPVKDQRKHIIEYNWTQSYGIGDRDGSDN